MSPSHFFLLLAYRGRLNTKDNMTTKNWIFDMGCDRCLASMLNGLGDEASRAQLIYNFVGQIQLATHALHWPVCFVACYWLCGKQETIMRSMHEIVQR
jgi:hypothetical protein